jgi:hypothetical protein
MRDDDTYSRLKLYGRGAGFAGWTARGRLERCEAVHGAGNCEQYAFVAYPKCKPGYYNYGCCICHPEKADCTKLGLLWSLPLNGMSDYSCFKRHEMGRCLMSI